MCRAGRDGARRATPRPSADDAGFSLIELMVACTLIGIVMSALTTFFTGTLSATNAQGNAQTALQLVNNALERVRALKGSALTSGRDKASTVAQWSAASAAVTPYLTTMEQVWDDTATYPAGATAPLPTTAVAVTVSSVGFAQHWYVGRCWQPALGGDCTATHGTGAVEFFRVIALVSWHGRNCPAAGCSQVATTLVSSASTEPVFNANAVAAAPKVTNPGSQAGELTVPVRLTLTATGGGPPLTWSVVGLPAGLTMDSGGLVTGTPTAVGTYSVTVSATDGFGLVGSAAFTWVVAPLPALTNPGTLTSQAGSAITAFTPTLTGGTSPLIWSAAGLPAGLSIDHTTGAITGTPTAAGTSSVTVAVTDTYGKAPSTTFSWVVVPPLSLVTPTAQATVTNTAASSVTMVASHGVKPYTWTATGLPAGLSLAPGTGVISGTPTVAGVYPVRVTVTDTTGKTASTGVFNWTVGPYITGPRTDQLAALGTAFTVNATANGGTAPYTWAATNLPSGVTMNGAGTVAGTPIAAGRYLVTLTVTDATGHPDTVPLVWTVTTTSALQIASAPTALTTVRGTAASVSPAATGGTGTRTWSITGQPTGIRINSSTGVVSGTPSTAGTYLTTLTVTDVAAKTSKWMFNWTVT